MFFCILIYSITSRLKGRKDQKRKNLRRNLLVEPRTRVEVTRLALPLKSRTKSSRKTNIKRKTRKRNEKIDIRRARKSQRSNRIRLINSRIYLKRQLYRQFPIARTMTRATYSAARRANHP